MITVVLAVMLVKIIVIKLVESAQNAWAKILEIIVINVKIAIMENYVTNVVKWAVI
jgi:hypothetical protein